MVGKHLQCIYLAILLMMSGQGIAQGEMANWYFGLEAALNFSSGEPEVRANSELRSIEACATISDSAGNLLFYSQADKIFNRHHEVMDNGELAGNNNASQGVGIVPMPGDSMKYYVFYLDFIDQTQCALLYAIVDMSGNNGRGEVLNKDQHLHYGITEKMTFVQRQDSFNVWLIVHDFNSDQYVVFLLSEAGISESILHATGITHRVRYGYLQPSPDGSILAAAVQSGYHEDGFIEVSRFNTLDGEVFGSFRLSIPNRPYGICFSPDNSKLYVSSGAPHHVYQFDLLQRDPDSIQDSRIQITTTPFINYSGSIGALQLAPNGKIYLARHETNFLAVINEPNQLGSACGYVENGVLLDGTGSCEGGLPNSGNLFWNKTPANILADPDTDDEESLTENPENGCKDVLVKPNPTTGPIILESFTDEISFVIVYDLMGRIVIPETIFNGMDIRLDEMQQLAAGAYIVRVKEGACVNQKKVVVMR